MITKDELKKMYWEQGLTLQEITDKFNRPYREIYRLFRVKYDIDTHKAVWKKLKIQDEELRYCLNNKYSNMRRRISGRNDPYQTYAGKTLLTEPEFVDFCNQNKQYILELWRRYIDSGKRLKYAISIDRIDNSKGYIKSNLQLVTHGFNSWKDDINPVAIIKDNQLYYFSSCSEAGRFFDCRADDLCEPLRGEKYNRQNVEIWHITVKELLEQRNCDDLHEYYDNHWR